MTEENTPNDDSTTEESSTSNETATAVAEPFDDHFRPVDIDQFTADDTVAGRAIGKLLTTLFLYTIVAMSISAWWTFAQGD